jgi:hypothetical protein
MVSVVLVLCGVLDPWEARTGGFRELDAPSGAERAYWPGLVWVSAGLLLNAALITTIGFILSCTLCYVLAVQGLRRASGQAGAKRRAPGPPTSSPARSSPPRCSGCSPSSWPSTCRA